MPKKQSKQKTTAPRAGSVKKKPATKVAQKRKTRAKPTKPPKKRLTTTTKKKRVPKKSTVEKQKPKVKNTKTKSREHTEPKKRKSKPGKKVKELWKRKHNDGKVKFVNFNYFESFIKVLLDHRQISGIDNIPQLNENGVLENLSKRHVIDANAKIEFMNRIYRAMSDVFNSADMIKKNRMTDKTGIRLNENDVLTSLNIHEQTYGFLNPSTTIDYLYGSPDLQLYLEGLFALMGGPGDMNIHNTNFNSNVELSNDKVTCNWFEIALKGLPEFDYRPNKNKKELAKYPFLTQNPKNKEKKSSTKTNSKKNEDMKDDEKEDSEEEDDSNDDDDDDDSGNEDESESKSDASVDEKNETENNESNTQMVDETKKSENTKENKTEVSANA